MSAWLDHGIHRYFGKLFLGGSLRVFPEEISLSKVAGVKQISLHSVGEPHLIYREPEKKNKMSEERRAGSLRLSACSYLLPFDCDSHTGPPVLKTIPLASLILQLIFNTQVYLIHSIHLISITYVKAIIYIYIYVYIYYIVFIIYFQLVLFLWRYLNKVFQIHSKYWEVLHMLKYYG